MVLYLAPPWLASLPSTTFGLGSAPVHAPEFRRRLLRWFRRHGRDLPWRRTRDPYRVLVSEFMLQQTQVSRVEAYYQRFLERYPTVQALAGAAPATVRESWDGLGYYRRAANLHRLARAVRGRTRRRRSRPTPPSWSALPGVGRYTAGAVASFAFERASPAIDTNVARVLRRAFHPRLAARGADRRALGDRRAHRAAPRASRLGLQSGDHGARRPDLYGASGRCDCVRCGARVPRGRRPVPGKRCPRQGI